MLIYYHWSRNVCYPGSGGRQVLLLMHLLILSGSPKMSGVVALAGHIMGFSLSSMSMMYEATGDEALKRKIEKMVHGLKECQDAQGDGYLLATINGRRIFEEVVSGKFTTNNPTINGVWEPVYIMNKIMLGLYNAYLSCDLPKQKMYW